MFPSPPSAILVMSGGLRLLRGTVPFGRVGRRSGPRRPCRRGRRDHGPIEECPGRIRLLPGLPQGSRRSPWDMGILRQAEVFRPVGRGWGGEAVCGRGAGGGSRRGSITNGTVGSRNASGRCAVGRQRNGSGSADPKLGRASGTPRRNASGESSGQQRSNSHRRAHLPSRSRRVPRRRTLARGHAADGIRRFFAIVLAVMSRRGIHLAPQRRIVGTTAVRPYVRPAIANASGCGARPKWADSNAAWNIRPHGPNAVKIVSLAAA